MGLLDCGEVRVESLVTTDSSQASPVAGNAHDFMSPMGMKMDESHIYEYS
jgi:hypothetical protein